jgi:hypothetical protein
MSESQTQRFLIESNHPRWLGDNVGYEALHMWVKKHLGRPDTCENCGKSDLRGHQIHWANISGLYKRIITDWRRLCVKCHVAFDKANRRGFGTRRANQEMLRTTK